MKPIIPIVTDNPTEIRYSTIAKARPWKPMLITAESVSAIRLPRLGRPSQPGPLPATPAPALGRGRARESFAPAALQTIRPSGATRPEAVTAYDVENTWAARRDAYRPHFAGFSSFHGSLTWGIVSNSTLASLPLTFSTRRI